MTDPRVAQGLLRAKKYERDARPYVRKTPIVNHAQSRAATRQAEEQRLRRENKALQAARDRMAAQQLQVGAAAYNALKRRMGTGYLNPPEQHPERHIYRPGIDPRPRKYAVCRAAVR